MALNTIAQLPHFLGVWTPGEAAAAVSGLSAGAIASFLLYRFVRRVPWPRPFRLRFALIHVAAALAFAVTWLLLSIAIESLFTGSLLETRNARPLHLREHPVLSLLLYAVVVGIAYSAEGRARTA